MAKVLLVDDDPRIRALLTDMLSERGYHVAEAIDGNAGLEALGRETFDLVVLDILMPGREGLETIREIRKKWAALPVLAISGGSLYGGYDFLQMASDFGASDTMAKPFLDNEFIARVDSLLERAKA